MTNLLKKLTSGLGYRVLHTVTASGPPDTPLNSGWHLT